MTDPPLLLGRSDVAGLFTTDDYIEAVEDAFRAHAAGKTLSPGLLHVDSPPGEFHVKSGGLRVGGAGYFGLKANGSFFSNPETNGQPAIQGIIYLADALTGKPVALLDSIEITIQRTGAATAAAAKRCARPDSSAVLICGAGRQGRVQLKFIQAVRRVTKVYVWDAIRSRSEAFAFDVGEASGQEVAVVDRPGDVSRGCDIVITCTPAYRSFIEKGDIQPGTFIGAIGADSPQKQELSAILVAESKLVTDVTAQCAIVGELHHAIAAGYMTADDVHAQLGEIITGEKEGRATNDEIIVYDATGTAMQDIACAAKMYNKARATKLGMTFDFAR